MKDDRKSRVRTERVTTMVDTDTRDRLEVERQRQEALTGVRPSLSTMAAILLNQALAGRREAAQ